MTTPSDRSPVEYRALLELAVREIEKHNASASYVTDAEVLSRLRAGAGLAVAIDPRRAQDLLSSESLVSRTCSAIYLEHDVVELRPGEFANADAFRLWVPGIGAEIELRIVVDLDGVRAARIPHHTISDAQRAAVGKWMVAKASE